MKTLKENASEKEKSDLLQELAVMKGLGAHPHVVRLLACCTEKVSKKRWFLIQGVANVVSMLSRKIVTQRVNLFFPNFQK